MEEVVGQAVKLSCCHAVIAMMSVYSVAMFDVNGDVL